MTTELRNAIEELIKSLDEGTFGRKTLTEENLTRLRDAYRDHLDSRTETAKRIDFLQNCLEQGMSKREAARALSEHDPRVNRKTAETLVYFNFSGQYRTTNRGRRRDVVEEPIVKIQPPDIEDDEAIL